MSQIAQRVTGLKKLFGELDERIESHIEKQLLNKTKTKKRRKHNDDTQIAIMYAESTMNPVDRYRVRQAAPAPKPTDVRELGATKTTVERKRNGKKVYKIQKLYK